MTTRTNYTITSSKAEAQRLVGKLYLEGLFGTPCFDMKVEKKKGLDNEDIYYVHYSFNEED